jgi:hypothetical protein
MTMSTDVEIYALVIRRLAEVDHGWGKPYDFHALYVLHHAVPGVEEDMDARVDGTAREFPFDEALRSALQARLTDLPAVTFVESFYDVYDDSRQGPNQVRNGGGFIALGPVEMDAHTAIVGAMFYGGHLWVRWLRYTVEQEGGAWRIASSKTLAVS